MFKGILIEKSEENYQAKLTNIDESLLGEGDVTVKVLYSTLNYKDALAITGKGPVVRKFPMIPGIDLTGIVEHTDSDKFNIGDTVLLNGFGVGEVHCGGLAQTARLKSEWLIKVPTGISAKQSMIIGTAGYTAMLCVMALEKNGITPDKGKILVTGANGGVGSFAISILSKLGYQVTASTGRIEQSRYLTALGATEIIDRNTLNEAGRPLAKEQWAGAIDSIGSHTLANICAGLKYGGTVAACGLAQGMDLPASVAPFILRGITLVGIDSVMRPLNDRIDAWHRLSSILKTEIMDTIGVEITLDKVTQTAIELINGEVQGRVVVNLSDS